MYIIVAGGGKIGYYLARELIAQEHEVLIIEKDARRVELISSDLGNVVYRGDACEASTLPQSTGSSPNSCSPSPPRPGQTFSAPTRASSASSTTTTSKCGR